MSAAERGPPRGAWSRPEEGENGITCRDRFLDRHRLGRPEVSVSRTAVAVRAVDDALGSVWAASPGSGDADVEALRHRLGDASAVHLSVVHPRATAALVGDVAYGVLPVTGSSQRGVAEAERVAREFVRRAETRLRPLVGIGRACAGLTELSRSRADAERVLRVLRHDALPARDATIHQTYARALVLEIGELKAADDIADLGPLAALREYDDKHGADLYRTLEAWLDAFGDVPAAAARLTVHSNTLRYRMNRIRQVGGVDLADPEARFSAMLHIRLPGGTPR